VYTVYLFTQERGGEGRIFQEEKNSSNSLIIYLKYRVKSERGKKVKRLYRKA
jgi:hypothetical protein